MTNWDDENDVGGDELDVGFTSSDVERSARSSFEPLPAGVYLMSVDDIKMQPTKDQTMVQAVVALTVADGEEHHGRKVWARHTKATSSDAPGKQTSLRIGRERIAELLDACGVGGSSLRPCIGQMVPVKLKVRPAKNGYDASNDVVAYLSDGPPMATTPAKPAPAAPDKPAPKPTPARPAFMARKG
jgi:hypothetical protein